MRKSLRHTSQSALWALEAEADVVALAIFVAAAAVVTLGRAPLFLRLSYGVPAVLLFPGLMLTALVFPRRRDLNGVERGHCRLASRSRSSPSLRPFWTAHPGGWARRQLSSR